MTALHTQGRLVAEAAAIFNESGDMVAQTESITDETDARRLVACWNAFEDAATEHIEALSETGGVLKASQVMTCLLGDSERELVAALALLADVLAADEAALAELKSIGMTMREMTEATGITERVRTFLEPKP